jgi:hypothetical protein
MSFNLFQVLKSALDELSSSILIKSCILCSAVDELSSLNVQLNQLMVQRRDALNEYLDLKGTNNFISYDY